MMDILPDYHWESPPDVDFAEEASLDDAAREAIERANGGPIPWHAGFDGGRELFVPLPEGRPVFIGIDYSSDYLDQQALMRVIGMISIADYKDAADAARFIELRQSATETPAAFVKRISLALLTQMAGVE